MDSTTQNQLRLLSYRVLDVIEESKYLLVLPLTSFDINNSKIEEFQNFMKYLEQIQSHQENEQIQLSYDSMQSSLVTFVTCLEKLDALLSNEANISQALKKSSFENMSVLAGYQKKIKKLVDQSKNETKTKSEKLFEEWIPSLKNKMAQKMQEFLKEKDEDSPARYGAAHFVFNLPKSYKYMKDKEAKNRERMKEYVLEEFNQWQIRALNQDIIIPEIEKLENQVDEIFQDIKNELYALNITNSVKQSLLRLNYVDFYGDSDQLEVAMKSNNLQKVIVIVFIYFGSFFARQFSILILPYLLLSALGFGLTMFKDKKDETENLDAAYNVLYENKKQFFDKISFKVEKFFESEFNLMNDSLEDLKRFYNLLLSASSTKKETLESRQAIKEWISYKILELKKIQEELSRI